MQIKSWLTRELMLFLKAMIQFFEIRDGLLLDAARNMYPCAVHRSQASAKPEN